MKYVNNPPLNELTVRLKWGLASVEDSTAPLPS